MNDPHRAEKLALARRKLKEFENKRRTDDSPTPLADGRCSSLSNGSVQSMDRIEAEREPFQVVNSNGSDNLHIDRQTNASSVSSINSSVVMTNVAQIEETGQILPRPYSSAIEARLVQERDMAAQAYEQMKQQLSDLHGHYAHLHAAYSHLSSNRAHSELESQIIQLQSAVSVLVEEKTTLQAELRVAREQCEQIATSHIKVQADAVQFQTEQELRNLRHKLELAVALTAAQATELEQQRRTCAETQARAISVQNEKSEAQLRVKALIRDRDALNEELSTVRRDLQMKSLHLKQLTKHQSQTPDETEAASDQIHAMTERLEAMTNELVTIKTERDAVIKDSETSRRQFERYTAELSERNGSLRQELEAAEAQRSFFESRAQELEMQLTHLQQSSVTSVIPSQPQSDNSHVEEHLKKIKILEEKLSETTGKLLAEKKDAGEQIERYSAVVAMKNEEVLTMSIKLRQLEERIQETRASESELLLLSEQLQSEKATVSRAVAQNKELKEQLLETEDRIFVLTNEKMQMEMDKEAAEHQVRVLSEQLGGSYNSSTNQDDSAEHLDANEAEALAMRTEREHELQQKLAQALHELTDMRQELRQSHSRNEQMNQIMMNNAEDENQNSIHVELGHAMTRVNQLAAENEQLRESLVSLQRRESELAERLDSLPQIEAALEARESPARERNESEVQEDVVDETEPVLSSPQNYTGPRLEQWARVELEKKFTESMRRNAELSDNLDKIEHINEQLQMENETIGDHVILYHQQRKIIQDRLRLKDQQLLAMEAEKQRVVERCRELQQAMREVLAAKDLPNPSSPLSRSVYRSYSHSTIDEINDVEDVVVSEEDANSQHECSTSQKDDSEVVYREEGRTSPQLEGTEAKVQRIFNILEEISTTPVKSADDMHCSHCIGELKKL